MDNIQNVLIANSDGLLTEDQRGQDENKHIQYSFKWGRNGNRKL